MFVRKRVVKAKGKVYQYFSVVENVRVAGKPRQRTVFDMGRRATIDECIADAQKRLDRWQNDGGQVAAAFGFSSDYAAVCRQRAQAEIARLTDLAARVRGHQHDVWCSDNNSAQADSAV